MPEIMTQQLKEFKTFLKKFKSMDDEIDKIFESGSEPSEELSDKFEELKEEYSYFMKYFKKYDMNLWESDEWTPLSVAQLLIAETYQ